MSESTGGEGGPATGTTEIATTSLRFCRKPTGKLILQQRFQTPVMSIWRDVPTVEEGPEPK